MQSGRGALLVSVALGAARLAGAQVIRSCAAPTVVRDADSGFVTSMRVIHRGDTLWREAPAGSGCLSGQVLAGDTLELLRSMGDRVEILGAFTFRGDTLALIDGRPIGRQQGRALLYMRSNLRRLRSADAGAADDELLPRDECSPPEHRDDSDTGFVVTTRQWRSADTLWSENPPRSGCIVGQVFRHDSLTMLRHVHGRVQPPTVYTFAGDSAVFDDGAPVTGRRETLLLMQHAVLEGIAASDSALARRGRRRPY